MRIFFSLRSDLFSIFLVFRFEEFTSLGDVQRLLTRLPTARDNNTLLRFIKNLNHTESFINITAKRQVVDGGVLEDVLFIKEEETSESDTFFFDEDTVVTGDVLGDISEEGNLEVLDTTLLAGEFTPGLVGEDGIDGAAEDLAVELGEFFGAVGEGENFGGADEGEVEGIEEEEDLLALVLGKTDLFDDLVLDGVPGLDGEVGSGLTDLGDGEALEAFRSSEAELAEAEHIFL